MSLAKHADLAVLLLALPVFLLAGFPMAAYLIGAVAWLGQKAIKEVAERRALQIAKHAADDLQRDQKAAIGDMRKVAGLTAGSMIGRGWLCALAIFGGWAIGGRDDDVGLASALLVVVLFSAYFATSMATRPFTPSNEVTS